MPKLTLEQIRTLRAGITPGEWQTTWLLTPSENRMGYAVADSRGVVLARIAPLDEVGAESGINAQAIAALPDLLEALEGALERELELELEEWRQSWD